VDFAGKRVAVVGTGSSGVQSIPIIAQQAAHLTVFQRTPSFSVPAGPLALDPAFVAEIKARYAEYRHEQRTSLFGVPFPANETTALSVSAEEREREYGERWARGGIGILVSYADLLTDKTASETIAEYFRDRIRDIVRDPVTAERLLPKGYAPGTKRLVVDINYYETYNRDNVDLVDVRETPILEITPTGIRTAEGHIDLDMIVWATGFDAVTGSLLRVDIRGRDGVSLRDAWADGPRAYLGVAVAGFPNLFTITGPQSPGVLSNMVVSIEQHVEWVTDLIAHLRDHGLRAAEPTAAAQEEWVQHVVEVADATLFPQTQSWYSGSNIPGKPRVFMPYVGGVGAYREECSRRAAAGYTGFELR
jgi:cyclohexanone monooxygenase